MKLSESIKRKFIEQKVINGWEVEAEDGYVPIELSNKTIEYKVYKIILENGLKLKCADNHILIDNNNYEIFAKDSLGKIIKTKKGYSKVISVKNLENKEHMFDLSINSKDHTYYSNDILSHNTSTSSQYLLWKANFANKIMTIGIAGNNLKIASEILDLIKKIFIELPIWLQKGIKLWNRTFIELEGRTRIMTSACNGDAFRGFTVNLLFIDEVAFIPKSRWEEFKDAVFPALEALQEKQIILASTPNGFNHFYEYCDLAMKPKIEEFTFEESSCVLIKSESPENSEKLLCEFIDNLECKENNAKENNIEENKITRTLFENEIKDINVDFNNKKIKITFIYGKNNFLFNTVYWKDVPRFNKDGSIKTPEVFRKEIIDKFGLLYFKQNYECEFLGSSETLINSSTLKRIFDNTKQPEKIDFISNGIKQYQEVKDNHFYIVSLDPKKEGTDGAGIQVIDVTNLPFKQVAVGNLNESFLTLPGILFELGRYYNNALVVSENNIGESIPVTLKYSYDYEGEVFQERDYKGKFKKEFGVRTTVKTKKLGLSLLKQLLENNQLIINDKETAEQLFHFIKNSRGSYEAEDGYHDDLVMSLMVALAPFFDYKNWDDFKGFIDYINTQKEEQERIQEQEEKELLEFLDLGFSNNTSEVEMFNEDLWQGSNFTYKSF